MPFVICSAGRPGRTAANAACPAGDGGHAPKLQGVQRVEPPELHVRRPNLSLDDLLRFVIKPLHVTLGDLIGCLCRF